MNTLKRDEFRPDGIFGAFSFDGEPTFCRTLEHSYDGQPKLQPGIYTCLRGTHALHNGVQFITFEITGVAGHKGILFHAGNFNKDSEGCVLVGHTIAINPANGEEMITGSRQEFAEFMERLEGVDEFELEVI